MKKKARPFLALCLVFLLLCGTTSASTLTQRAVDALSGIAPWHIAPGDRGRDARDLQLRLQELHYYTGEITGTFDADTQSAYQAFCAGNDLAVEEGVSQENWGLVFTNEVMAAPAPPAAPPQGREGLFGEKQPSAPANPFVPPPFQNGFYQDITPEEIIAAEGEPDRRDTLDTDVYLVYNDRVFLGYRVMVVYHYSDDVLSYVGYSFDEAYGNTTFTLADFQRLRDDVVAVYGQPDREAEEWKNERYKDDPTKHELALAQGDLSYSAYWTLEDGVVYEISLGDRLMVSLFSFRSSLSEAAPLADTPANPFAPAPFKDGFSKEITQEEIIAVEGAPDRHDAHESGEMIWYDNRSALGYRATLLYSYYGGVLDNVWYGFDEAYGNTTFTQADFQRLRDEVIAIHGQPDNEKVEWENDRYQNDPSKHALALAQGDVSYRAYWYISDELSCSIHLTSPTSLTLMYSFW